MTHDELNDEVGATPTYTLGDVAAAMEAGYVYARWESDNRWHVHKPSNLGLLHESQHKNLHAALVAMCEAHKASKEKP